MELGIPHLLPALLQILQAAFDCLERSGERVSALRQCSAQRPEANKHRCTKLSVFQLAQTGFPKELIGGDCSRTSRKLCPDIGQMLRSVAPVQNPHRVRPVQVAEALRPLGPVQHRTHLPGIPGATLARFHRSQPAEALVVRHPREVGQGPGPAPLLPAQTAQWFRWPGSSPPPIPRPPGAPSLRPRSTAAVPALLRAPPPSHPPAPRPAPFAIPPRPARSSRCPGAPGPPTPRSAGSVVSSFAAGPKGLQLPNRTRSSTRLGVREPGSSPNSSSRRENPLSKAGGAHSAAAPQFDRLVLAGAQPADLLSPALQPIPAPGAAEAFILPATAHIPRPAGQRYVL